MHINLLSQICQNWFGISDFIVMTIFVLHMYKKEMVSIGRFIKNNLQNKISLLSSNSFKHKKMQWIENFCL